MRQEPDFEKPRWVIIGYGRLGRTLASLLQLRGENPVILRSTDSDRLENITANSERVLICVPDSNISEILARKNGEGLWIHFSATISDPRAHRVHPMRSFDGSILSEIEFAEIPFALETNSPPLSRLLPGFRNPSFELSSEEFQKYHALCVLSASFPVLIWSLIETEMQRIGIKPEHLRNYAAAVGRNYAASGPEALTGPWVRNDEVTTERNESALAYSPLLKELYGLALSLFRAGTSPADERNPDAVP
jgi:hypothetical protein